VCYTVEPRCLTTIGRIYTRSLVYAFRVFLRRYSNCVRLRQLKQQKEAGSARSVLRRYQPFWCSIMPATYVAYIYPLVACKQDIIYARAHCTVVYAALGKTRIGMPLSVNFRSYVCICMYRLACTFSVPIAIYAYCSV
jgi:hypothetical protein